MAVSTSLPPSTPEPHISSPAISPKTVPHSLTSTSATTIDFSGPDLDPNNSIPSIREIENLDDYQVFDKEGKAVKFRSLYTGENVARRILLVFVRHFFCGNCQSYLRTLSTHLPPTLLLSLPTPTFLCIIGCGQPSLIPMYESTTTCPYPIYADPSKGLYRALHMGRTLELGPKPEYQRESMVKGMVRSIGQGLSMVKGGKVWKGGDYMQVGGEFLFEPRLWDLVSPGIDDAQNKQLGYMETQEVSKSNSGEDKHITWCHRMRNTRDHAEIPELMEILGISSDEVEGGQGKRWDKAMVERKGVALNGTGKNSGGRSGSFRQSNGNEGGESEVDFGRRVSRGSRASSEKLMGNGEEVKGIV